MFVDSLKKIVCSALFAASAMIAAPGASATYYYFDIYSDAGSYDPLVLGEDLELDGCGSEIYRADYTTHTAPVYGLCDLTDYSIYSISWELTFNNVTSTLASFVGSAVSNGLTQTIATGANTLISQAGTYTVGLWVEFESNSYFTTPEPYWVGNHYTSTGRTGNDSGYIPSQSGLRNTDYSSSSFTVSAPPSSVPEPSSILVLLGGLALVARRERKKLQA